MLYSSCVTRDCAIRCEFLNYSRSELLGLSIPSRRLAPLAEEGEQRRRRDSSLLAVPVYQAFQTQNKHDAKQSGVKMKPLCCIFWSPTTSLGEAAHSLSPLPCFPDAAVAFPSIVRLCYIRRVSERGRHERSPLMEKGPLKTPSSCFI